MKNIDSIEATDDALIELEPSLGEFVRSRGFVCAHSLGNVPRRWLRRESAGIRHEIFLLIVPSLEMRFEEGVYQEVHCKLCIAASDLAATRHYRSRVFEAQPVSLLRDLLRRHLPDAINKLDACTSDFILRYDVHDAAA
jgi:hypothetical protein